MRQAAVERKTLETDTRCRLTLEGGDRRIATGIGFFDHMLTAFAVHGGFGLDLQTKGDLQVDCHHTIEDTGIVLGQAFAQALGDKSGIERYATFTVPMDESLATVSVDVSGRPFLVCNASFENQSVGGFDCAMTEEFFRAFAFAAGITLHVNLAYGRNDHHKIEAIFKAAAHAMRLAVQRRGDGAALSTKGSL